MKTQNICLVTGGAGFIGSNLCDKLIAKGYEVYCLDNLITGSKKNITHLSQNRNFHFFFHDVIKPLPKSLATEIKNIRYVYHLASPASPPYYRKYSIETLLVNSMGTFNMLELARLKGATFLLASTSEVYGNPQEHPQKETYFGNVNPVGLRACYDESKRFAEALTMEYRRKYGLAIRIVRIFNTYGPRMGEEDGRVISNFVVAAISGKPLTLYGDGLQTRSFCYISDMIDGLIRAAEKKGIDGQVLNLGNPEEYTIKEVGKMILKLTNSSSPMLSVGERQEDDPVRRKPDIGKAKRLISWQPKISLVDGLSKTIKYFQQQ